MCPPTSFAVTYTGNPWMDPSTPVDRDLALHQWQVLRDTYRALGHRVATIDPVADLPDMVFAANGGFVRDGRAVAARFRNPQRAAEADAYAAWYAAAGYATVAAEAPFEGEGDLLVVGDVVLAGHGFRTDPRAHRQVAEVTGAEIVSLELVDPRYYHLDVALCPLGDTIAYLPAAFADAARAELEGRYPDAIEVTEEDAAWLALNALCDGLHVVLPVQAETFAAQVAAAGFQPVPVDVSEFRKSGGGVKCMTAELH
ncbi:MAG: hypothetical protein KY457_11880 [Actinobacteria bacterium]|nr:hypothetical protein [Actinomycetota bacterium]